jgi:outer membrane receptor protein involved in Fe transport
VRFARQGTLGALLGAVLFPSLVLAQAATSVLTGNVVDASSNAPVPDVVVTATSPSLQGEQVVVTDSTGLYRIPQLPPGVYQLRFEKESYRPYTRAGIEVAADRTLRVNIQLLPEVAGETVITVIGTPPVLDVTSSTTGATIGQDYTRNLAVSRPGGLGGANRSFDSLATIAPQATADTFGVSLNGATSPENSYLIDGLSVNDPAYGVLGTPLTSEFVDEVNVITGGYMPEYGRTTGGTISAVTKSGGNEFHGSVFGTFTPGGLAGTPATVASAGSTVQGSRSLHNIGDFGATLGGYILKDKLWFFTGVQLAYQRYSYERFFAAGQYDANGNPVTDVAGQQLFTPIANSSQRRFGDEHSINYIGKLTYLINPDHRLSVSVTGTPTHGGGDGVFALQNSSLFTFQSRAPLGPFIYTGGTFNSSWVQTKNDALDVSGELNSSFLEKRLLLDVRFGWHHQLIESVPGDGSEFNINKPGTLAGTPEIVDVATKNILAFEDQVPASVRDFCSKPENDKSCQQIGWVYGGTGFMERLVLDSYQGKATVTFLVSALGHHVFKAGADGVVAYYDHTKTYGGGVAYNYNLAGNGIATIARRFGFLTAKDTPGGNPLLEKTSKSVTVGGFIQDSWAILDKVTLNVGIRYDTQALYSADGTLGLAFPAEWSPRIGLVWDPTQAGKAKLFANYGRYFENVPLDIADRALSVETQLRANQACNPLVDGVAGCDAKTLQRGGSVRSASTSWRNLQADKTAVDPNIQPTSNDEIVAGGELEVMPNARVGLTYTYRNLVRTVEDMSADDGNTYFLGNPGSGIARTFPKAERRYHAVTASFTKTFSDLWMAQVSYTWAQLRGNYDGLFVQDTGQLDPNINATFDLIRLLVNQSGPLSNDVTHTVKVYLAKEFILAPTFSITLGGSYTGASGTPINYLGPSNDTGYGPNQVFFLERGQGGRLPWVHTIDARVALNYRFTKDLVLSAAVDGFNLFNFQHPVAVDQGYILSDAFGDAGPIVGGRQGSVSAQYGKPCGDAAGADPATLTGGCGNGSLPRSTASGKVILPLPDQSGGAPFTINPNWGRPTQYQATRLIRFSVRLTF